MSNEVMIPDVGAVPAHLQQAGPVDSGLVTTSESIPRISLKQSRFRFIVDGEEVKVLPAGEPLRAVIVGVSPRIGCSKVYYKGAYEPGSDEPPDCSSSDGVYPDTGINMPMSDMCQTCPMNAWGTGTKADGSPSKGKACRDTKILFIVGPPKVANPDTIGNANMLLQLRVPVMSLKSLSNLGHALEKRRLTPHSIVTKMTFEDSTDWPQLKFEFDSFLSEGAYTKASELAASEDLRRLVVDPATAPTLPHIPPKPAADPAPAPAPAPAADPAPEVPPQTAAPAEEAVDVGSLWDDTQEETAVTPPAVTTTPPVSPPTTFQGPGQNPADGLWYDKTGTVWNPAIHGTAAGGGPAFKKDQTFKAKRGLKAPVQTPAATVQTPAATVQAPAATVQAPAATVQAPVDPEDDPLKDWLD